MVFQNIARQVEWQSAIKALGLHCEQPNRSPASINCPFCGGLLFIRRDDGFAGNWARCLKCFAGDMIDLAAQLWKTSPQVAIQRLSRENALRGQMDQQQLDDYLHRYIALRRRAEEFWDVCRDSLSNDGPGSLSHLCWEVRQRLSGPRYQGLQLGSCTVQQAQNFFYPASYAPRPRLNRNGKRTVRRGSGPGASRLFPGKDWGRLLVIRFEDAPGRLCGFLFIGRREGDVSDHHIYRSVVPPRSPRDRDAGVVMLGSLNALCHDYFGGTMFVMDDVDRALRWQYRWLRTEYKPAPIIAFHPDHLPSHVLEGISISKAIFCSTRIDVRLLKLARQMDGKVARIPSKASDWGVRHDLQELKRRAVSWRTYLDHLLQGCTVDEAKALFLDLGFDGNEVKRTLERSSNLSRRLSAVLKEPGLEPYMLSQGRRVVSRDDGLYMLAPETKVTSGAVRIEHMVATRDGTKYHGFVEQNGQRIPFLVSADDDIKRGFFTCLHSIVAESGHGPFDFDKRLKGSQGPLVAYLSSAKGVTGADSVGWHDQRFWLPDYAIRLAGSVEPGEGAFLAGQNAPGGNLGLPRELTSNELGRLSKCTRETRLFWALTACVAHNLTAPMRGKPPVAIGLVGTGAQVIGQQAAPMLGCPTIHFPSAKTYRLAAEELNRVLAQHYWPQHVHWTPADAKRLALWMGHYRPTNCIVPLNADMADLAFRRGWHLVRSERYFDELDFLGQAGFAVIPAYLQDLCRRRGDHCNRGETLLLKILNDLANWFTGIGGQRRAVERADHVLHVATSEARTSNSGVAWIDHHCEAAELNATR